MRQALTTKQTEVLKYITEFISTHRYSPTLEEISESFGLVSRGGACKHAQNLKAKGGITWADGKQRTISLTEDE